jgi:hypothetical protein
MLKRLSFVTGTLTAALVLASSPARAQFLGHNFRGDFGLQSGSQPAPGLNLSVMYLRYSADVLRDRNGDEFRADIPGEVATNGIAAGIYYVTEKKFLGANYGFMAFPAFTDNKLEVPILSVDQEQDFGFTDLYFQPLNLGWHRERADFIAGFGVYAPTGRYDVADDDNRGLGMWSFELLAGTTLFFDEAKSWSFAATVFYETHTTKRDTDIKVGDLVTLEGGFGKSFMEGAVSVGLAYYGQWKVTDDDVGRDLEMLLEGRRLGRNRVYGFGPEVTVPIATKSKLIALINARYFWETGARTTLEGQTFLVTATFPIPSVPLQ